MYIIFPYITVSPVGYIKRTSWSDEEKSFVLETFRENIEQGTLPSSQNLATFISRSPLLRNRNEIQLKSWISNQIQKKKNGNVLRRRKGMQICTLCI